MSRKSIPIDQLAIGLKIHLSLPWMKHPFVSNAFVIKNKSQIRIIKSLGQKNIDFDPDKSLTGPSATAEPQLDTDISTDDAMQELWTAKLEKIEQLEDRQNMQEVCEALYTRSVASASEILKGFNSNSETVLLETEELINGMVNALLASQELTLNLVNTQGVKKSEECHSINVAVLSMIMGKSIDMDQQQLIKLGMAAMLHDIGKTSLPKRVYRMHSGFTQGERNVYKSHVKLGIKLLHNRGMQDKDILRTIAQHHEFNDGSGFPNKLTGNQITQAAQIVAIADMYDSLCNPGNSITAVSPHEAVSVMYNKYKPKFNSGLLSNFINSVGIYPPGTIVKLSNQCIGMVLSFNPGKLLHPNVLIYDQEVSRNKAIIINLQDEQDLSIKSGLNAKEVSPKVREYLNPGLSAYYYFDSI